MKNTNRFVSYLLRALIGTSFLVMIAGCILCAFGYIGYVARQIDGDLTIAAFRYGLSMIVVGLILGTLLSQLDDRRG